MLELVRPYMHDTVVAILAISVIAFVIRFVIPALLAGRRLGRAIKQLSRLRKAHEAHVTDLDEIAKTAMLGKTLAHCWSEFAETLHPQKEVDEFGQERVFRWRSTAMSDVFFTEQALVETPLRTEFYKHLPGILTGIGIIGTFSGLIFGLIDFQITEDANVVRSSLATLIQNVGQAFILSGSAIALAMIITWLEKSLITRRFKQVEHLCQLIDSLFDAGAGEEYLARLVNAAEESATQAAHMKDSLVTDLKQILTELTEQQIQAAGSHSQQISSAVVGAINESLQEPMQRLSAGMQTVARDQGTAINSLLTDVLAGFTAKMDDMFGAQMRGMNEALAQTSQAIQTAASKFDQLASNLNTAGENAADAMHKRLETMVTAMDERQLAMNEQMMGFVETLKTRIEAAQTYSADKTQKMVAELGQQVGAMVTQLQDGANASQNEQSAQLTHLGTQMTSFLQRMEETVRNTQGETATQLGGMLTTLGDQTTELMSRMEAQNATSAAAQRETAAAFATETQNTVTQLASQVEGLTATVQTAADTMKSVVTELSAGTKQSITQLGQSADQLTAASTRFSQSLGEMSTTAASVSTTSQQLVEAARQLQGATSMSQQALQSHRDAQEAMTQMVSELQSTVENASRDARLTSDLVASLQAASTKLSDVHSQAENYLSEINAVLAEAHQAFASAIKGTLADGNKQFHVELGKAVEVLRGAILDLGETLDTVRT